MHTPTAHPKPGRTRPLVLLIALLAALSLFAAACGGSDSSDDAADSGSDSAATSSDADSSADDDGAMDDDEVDEFPVEPLRVAVVAPSASNDLAFTQSMVDAVNAVAGDRELEIAVTDGTFIVEDAAAAIRGYAEENFDLVIAHGSQYGGPLQEIAPDFPDTAFAWGTAVDTFGIENVSAYTVRADEGGYVNGVMAAQLSETGVIGVVGPIEVGDAKLYVDGFVAGAEATADVTVNVNYIESFSDVALAAEAAQAHIQNDADVLTGTAQMVVGATGVAGPAGAKWFGTQSNQTPLGPDFVVASQVYHWEVVLDDMMAAIDAGNFGGEVYTLNLENGGLEIEFNDAVELPAGVRASAEQAITLIAAGGLATDGSGETGSAAPAPAGPLKVAVVAPSASNDLAFTQSMVDAVNAVAGDRELEIAVTDGTFIVEDAAAAIRGYAEDDFDLVIAHGSQYGGPLQEIAPDFPDTAFAWGTAVDTFGIENVSAYTVRSDEGGYINGALAAGLSETGVIGVVGPIEVGDAKLYVDGFVAGAEATADVTVNVNYIESFSDVALAAEAAQAHIQNDADVLTGTAQMVVGATGIAGPAGAKWFGTQSNQTPLGPDFVVASQVYHWEVVLDDMMAAIDAGNFGGEVYTLNLENGGLVIELNDGAADAGMQDTVDELVAAIIDGSIKTGAEEG